MNIVVNKQLVGLEDLLVGTGEELQLRGGNLVPVTKLNFGNLFAANTINVVTLDAGELVTIDVTDDTITFGIPKGVAGSAGVDGMTPQYEFVYNETTGDLEYTLTGYIPSTDVTSGEW